MSERARDAATQIGTVLEKALRSGTLSESDLFKTVYEPVAGTDPQKYTTGFDRYCDQWQPAIQKQVLSSDQAIAFAITADCNGYVPTHNNRYCKALTGNRAVDTANNRTKRLFGDHVGRTVGRHTEKWMLQIYRRDTGEIMFDMSAPIHVDGRHCGGFRIGYTL